MNPLVSFIVLSFLFCSIFCVTIKVEPKGEECFYEEAKKNDDLTVKWNVIDGGLLDIEVRIKQNDQLIFSKLHFESKDEGVYKTKADSDTVYAVCFNNEMARYTPKTVHFELAAETPVKEKPIESLTPMEKSVRRIANAINYVEEHVKYIHYREATHRNTAENTNSKVKWWAIIKTFALLVISVGQVYYLKLKVNKSNMAKRRV